MKELDRFKQHYHLAARFMDRMSKEHLTEVTRLLALRVAQYQSRYGALPVEDLLSQLGEHELTDAQFHLLAEGMEILVGYLGTLHSARQGVGHEADASLPFLLPEPEMWFIVFL